jgi:hypothetical protein
MATEIRIKTVVLPGNKIEVSTPQLVPGQEATVVVLIDESLPVTPHVIDILRPLAGHRLFQQAEEVETYLREKREAWER